MQLQLTFGVEYPHDELTQAGFDVPVNRSRIVAGLIVPEVVELETEPARAGVAQAGRSDGGGRRRAEREPIELTSFVSSLGTA